MDDMPARVEEARTRVAAGHCDRLFQYIGSAGESVGEEQCDVKVAVISTVAVRVAPTYRQESNFETELVVVILPDEIGKARIRGVAPAECASALQPN